MQKFILSQETALKHLKKLFSNYPSDAITIEEAYKAEGRDLRNTKANKIWLGNEVIKLKQHGLITTRLGTKDNRRRITHLELTERGRIVLNRAKGKLDSPEIKNGKNQETDVIHLITQLGKANPKRKVVYSISEGTISLQE